MRIRGTDRKAVAALVAASPAVNEYARLYPSAKQRAVDIVTGLSADYEAQGMSILIETTDTQEVRLERLRAHYDLTLSEAALALHIADGGKMVGYVEVRGITRNTARNQLQQVFDKTGARRQAELVRLLADF